MPVSTLLSTFSGLMPKYRCAIVMNVLVSGGTTDPMTMPVTLRRIERAVLEELRHPDADLVGRPLAQRRKPPALDEPLALEHAEHDIGVADVNR